jgi:hypothetical protein
MNQPNVDLLPQSIQLLKPPIIHGANQAYRSMGTFYPVEMSPSKMVPDIRPDPKSYHTAD